MPITVAAIEEKEFKTKMRGYDPEEVDEFLDEICDEMVAMQEEIATLQARLAQAARSNPAPFAPPAVPVPAPAPAPVPAAKEPVKQEAPREDGSEAAQKLLARAQKVYDETVADAKAEAEKILAGAHQRADAGLEALEDEKAALQDEVKSLKAAARDYRDRFQRLLDDQQHVLNAESKLFE